MSVVECLERLGGVATRGVLIAVADRISVDRALESGDIVVLARGRYALPEVDAARAGAHRVAGAVSWRSAAQAHGWELLRPPEVPEVTVPASRKLRVLTACEASSSTEVRCTPPRSATVSRPRPGR